jgi:hypothetical protein
MYSMVIVDPLLPTTVPTLDPVKEDLEKAAASTAKRATIRGVKDFMVDAFFTAWVIVNYFVPFTTRCLSLTRWFLCCSSASSLL